MDSVEFTFYIQELPDKNNVTNFVEKMKAGFTAKGYKEGVEYTLSVRPRHFEKGSSDVMHGGSDSSFPYNIFERIFDYIDNNVKVLRPENIKTDEYQKTSEVKKRTLDGLFAKPVPLTKDDIEKAPTDSITKPHSTWDELFEPNENIQRDKRADSIIDDVKDTVEDTKKSVERIGETIKEYTVGDDGKTKYIDGYKTPVAANVAAAEPPPSNPTAKIPEQKKQEEEYVVIVSMKRELVRMCISNNMGQRELRKLF